MTRVHIYQLTSEVNGHKIGTEFEQDPEGCDFYREYSTQKPYFYINSNHLAYIGARKVVKHKELDMILPTDAQERKGIPITTGVLDYFPLAIAEVAKCSWAGNQQHHPGEVLHWDKTKSTDHADCISRHLIDRGKFDSDGKRHSAKLAWRALALLQIELEEDLKKGKRDD